VIDKIFRMLDKTILHISSCKIDQEYVEWNDDPFFGQSWRMTYKRNIVCLLLEK